MKDIQTLVAGLSLFTAANPWERWRPSKPPSRMMDLGANIGLASLYFSLRFPSAQVAAVEMMPENAAAVIRLAELNGLDIKVVNVAVGATDGTATVRLNQSHTRHSLDLLQRVEADANRWGFIDQKTDVTIMRLGRVLRELGWPSVDLLKVDIEGAEKLLLEDIDDWAGMVNDVLLEVHHNVDVQEAAARMTGHGFKSTGQDERQRTELWFSK